MIKDITNEIAKRKAQAAREKLTRDFEETLRSIEPNYREALSQVLIDEYKREPSKKLNLSNEELKRRVDEAYHQLMLEKNGGKTAEVLQFPNNNNIDQE